MQVEWWGAGALWPPVTIRGVRRLQTGEDTGVGDRDLGVVAGRNSCLGWKLGLDDLRSL